MAGAVKHFPVKGCSSFSRCALCCAVDALCEVSAIDTLLSNFIRPLQGEAIATVKRDTATCQPILDPNGMCHRQLGYCMALHVRKVCAASVNVRESLGRTKQRASEEC